MIFRNNIFILQYDQLKKVIINVYYHKGFVSIAILGTLFNLNTRVLIQIKQCV